jgi:hypothetical protein
MTCLPFQYQQSDEWNVLAMLQSMTIYILIRIYDEDSFPVDFDNQMIETMTVSTFADLMPHFPQLADKLQAIAIKSEQSGFLCHAEAQGQPPHWDEWILMESKRRQAMLFIITESANR